MALGLDTLTNAFTGQPIKDAAAQQRSYLTGLQNTTNQNILNAQNLGLSTLQGGQAGALGSIAGGIDTARSDISGALSPALAALYGGQSTGLEALTGGRDQGLAALQSGVTQAQGAYSPLGALGAQYAGYTGQSSDAQADALGLNGPEGVARAQGSFQAGPGFQFALGQGLDAISRAQNATGMGASGNTLRSAQKFGQGLGQQEWDKYLANLQGRQALYAPLGASATGAAASGIGNAALTGGTGAANIYTGTGSKAADLAASTGQQAAGAYTGAGQSLAQLASQGGLAAGNVQQQSAQSQADLINKLLAQQTGFAQNTAGMIGQTYGAEGLAAMAGANNLWNLVGGGAKKLAGAGLPI